MDSNNCIHMAEIDIYIYMTKCLGTSVIEKFGTLHYTSKVLPGTRKS
jgi:uncharacterized protein YlbG (UPF0298 family)